MDSLPGYGIDSHKLMYHVERLHRWLKGEDIYPIYIEAAPAGGCNQRCIFCGLDYLGYTRNFIDLSCWKRFVKEAAKKGLKSVLLSGEGEPLLHPAIGEFARSAKKSGLDVAMATNAVLLDRKRATECLTHLTWLRVSLDAGSRRTYQRIHRVAAKEFDTVVGNVRGAVRMKKARRLPVTIGIQFLLLQENYKDLERAIRLARQIGVDYFSIKPYSKHPLSLNTAGTEIDYSQWMKIERFIGKYETPRFKVIFRKGAIARKAQVKPYKVCLGLPFWAYISASGDMYPCSTFLGLKKYCIGNICKQGFSQIWKGKKRRSIMLFFSKMDARTCRELCRLDEINAYLWRLQHPSFHVNFI